jgi:hypothetical protein
MVSQVLKARSVSSTAWHLTMVAWCSFETLESQSPDTASHPRKAEFFNYATTILMVINTFQSYFFSVLPPSDLKYKIIHSLLIRMRHPDVESITYWVLAFGNLNVLHFQHVVSTEFGYHWCALTVLIINDYKKLLWIRILRLYYNFRQYVQIF